MSTHPWMRDVPCRHRDGARDPPTLVVISAVRFLRESLGEVLGRDGALSVLGLAATLDEAISCCRDMRADLVLFDAAFPDGVVAVSRLRAAAPAIRVVALAVIETEEAVIRWAEAGAAGYVPSTAALSDLVSLLLGIAEGRQHCSDAIAAALLRRIAGAQVSRPLVPIPTLTLREREVMRLVSAGLSNKDIARKLNIGVATTKSHVHNLLSKLNIQRRGQAAGWMRDNAI
jgi:DNA-binding NarL/FixJ family response regulator